MSRESQSAHYGLARMTVGSILNWQGSRYFVVAVEHGTEHTEIFRYQDTAYYGSRTMDRSIYTLQSVKSRSGALYTCSHNGGYITRPKRIKIAE